MNYRNALAACIWQLAIHIDPASVYSFCKEAICKNDL